MTLLDKLETALDALKEQHRRSKEWQASQLRQHGIDASLIDSIAGSTNWIETEIDRARPFLSALLEDQSARTANDLQDLASILSPGGAHTGGWLACELMDRLLHWNVDPRLFAAMIYFNWHGGKAGFQFLPDPANTDQYDYESAVENLLVSLEDGGAPDSILVDEDRAFYDSLPARFTVYRGTGGLTPEIASAGICWTIDREIAEWFAVRSADINDGEPLVMTAKVHKGEIKLAKASEKEVVVLPRRARAIKCRRKSLEPRPDFDWQAPSPQSPVLAR